MTDSERSMMGTNQGHGEDENDIHNDLSTTICCPICYQQYDCGYTEDYREGATYDCPECNGLLLFRKGHVLDFHKYLHYGSKGSWPIDGNDSGFIEIGGL